jgi:signal peptidase I
MAGDNRSHSHDSRAQDMGPIPRERILGKAIWRHWPLDMFGPMS